MNNPQTYEQILKEEKLPAVAIDHNSMFTFVNKAFQDAYGWGSEELLGKSVTEIIPTYLRDAHQIGFARFMSTEQATLLGVTLPLAMLYKDGKVRDAEHYIVGHKKDDRWSFAATIIPQL
jgi:PAS domain S-box-containing protein